MYPPTTWIHWPVVWLDFGESRNATMLAISSQVVMRRSNGTLASILLRVWSGFGWVVSHFSYMGVQHSATITQLTRMPYLPNSTAHSRVSALRPPLAAA